jgi:putative PIN family toxin of toxin-antitoxin system
LIATTVPCVVLDTNVWLDLLVFRDARVAFLFDALHEGRLRAASNPACRDEWTRVLRYPALALSESQCVALEAAYDQLSNHCARSESSAPVPLPHCKDRDDQKFLELAREAHAVALLSRDAELLKLARRAQRGAGFAILRPEAFALPATVSGPGVAS